MEETEDFILFLLATFRGQERGADFRTQFAEGEVERNGYVLPKIRFMKKTAGKGDGDV